MTYDPLPHLNPGSYLIVGGYGSGKTEVSVNMAVQAAAEGLKVRLIDLDIINPYFRCREARELLTQRGIEVVVPGGELAHADLPIILPRVTGLLRHQDDTCNIFDVGGDDMGAIPLASLKHAMGDHTHLWYVINGKRPFCQTPTGCLRSIEAIEKASTLLVEGLLVNSHMMGETTSRTVYDGWHLACEISLHTGLPVQMVAAMSAFRDSALLEHISAPILWMERYMLPPWKLKAAPHPTAVASPKDRYPVNPIF